MQREFDEALKAFNLLTFSPSLSPWECAHCTTVNQMQAVLCMTCERPRLATAVVQDSPMSLTTGETCLFLQTLR